MPNIQPGQCDIHQLDIVSFDGSKRVGILGQVATIDIYESILNPVIMCNIGFNDGVGLYESFPIVGNEYIEIEYQTTGYNNPTSHKFKVISVSNRTVSENSRATRYSITCTAQEIIRNNSRVVETRFSDCTATEIVDQMLNKELQTKKKTFLEQSNGTENFLASRLKPFQVIDMVKLTAASSQFRSSVFVFFENKTGFNFTTVENLFQIGQGSIGDKVFTMDPTMSVDSAASSFRNIIGQNHITSGAPVGGVGSGTHFNKTMRLDLRTGVVDTKDFRLSENEGNFKFADKSPVGLTSTSFQQEVSENNSTTLLYPTNSKYNDNRFDTAGSRQSYINLLTQNIMRIAVHGDSLLTAGQVITLNIPVITGTTGDSSTKTDRLLSGNYLIGKIRHQIVVQGGGTSYLCAIEALKGSFGASE